MFCTLVQGRGWQRLPEPQVSRDGEFRQRTRKKSVQIILPSGDALRFVLVSAQSDKMQTGRHQKKRRATLLSCQLPPLRAEGSKNVIHLPQWVASRNHDSQDRSTVDIMGCKEHSFRYCSYLKRGIEYSFLTVIRSFRVSVIANESSNQK